MAIQNFQILIVDDNKISRDMLARRLSRKDFNLSIAVDGRAALSMIQSNAYDLIFLDIMMPEIDGYAVLKYLKKDPRLCNIPVIIVSAFEEMDSVMQCMEIGADDYLTKPFDPEMLKSAINRCLPSRTPSNLSNTAFENTNDSSKSTSMDTDNQIADFNLPEHTTRGRSTNTITIDEVVLRIMQSGIINRKSYLYLSKAIYNSLFENIELTDQEVYQINSVFAAIQSGRIRVVDSIAPSKL